MPTAIDSIIILDKKCIETLAQIKNFFIKLNEKIQFIGFIINLFRVYSDPLQIETGIPLCI